MQEGNSGHGLREVFLREGKKKGAHGLKKETPVLRGMGVMKGKEGSVGSGGGGDARVGGRRGLAGWVAKGGATVGVAVLEFEGPRMQ